MSQSPTSSEPRESFSSAANMTITAAGNVDHTAGLTEDQLGFRPYVEAVYSYLKNEQTKAPFTISIEGDWGSGKSSFMHQLEQSLQADNLPTVKFNAWRHDKVEAMWAAFALHFVKDLLYKLSPMQRIIANMRLHIKRFDIAKGWFSLVKTLVLLAFYGLLVYIFFKHSDELMAELFKDNKIDFGAIFPVFGTAGVVIGLLFFLKGLSDITGNPFKADLQKYVNKPNYEGNVAFIEEFHRDFSQTVDILSGKHKKIFVFIDDLDRAEIPKAAELMQGLNMMISNSPKLIFIIGMDREKVAAGVAAKYKDLLPFLNAQQADLKTEEGLKQAQFFGYQFLEKFIQLSFQIPKASPVFTRRFIDSLSGASEESQNNAPVNYNPVLVIQDGKDSEQFRQVTRLLAPFFEHNPRRIKQFVNIFRLKAHIANSTGLFNDDDAANPPLTIPQLGKFIAIGILVPQFIEDLHQDNWLIANLLQNDDQDVPWKKNAMLALILKLSPENEYDESYIDDDYRMDSIDVKSLLETSPLLQAQPGGAAAATEQSNIDDTQTYRAETYESNESSASHTRHACASSGTSRFESLFSYILKSGYRLESRSGTLHMPTSGTLAVAELINLNM
jgi:hypothetical protein